MSHVRNATVEEVEAFDLENGRTAPVRPGEYRAYQGPYPTVLSERNHWTHRQETAEFPAYEVPPVALEPETGTFDAAGGDGSIAVTKTGQGIDDSWMVDQDGGCVAWVTLLSPANHTPITSWPGEVYYTVAENTSGSAREGYFYINGKTHTISQAA